MIITEHARKLLLLTALICALALIGCGGGTSRVEGDSDSDAAAASPEADAVEAPEEAEDDRARQLAEREAEIARREADVAKREAEANTPPARAEVKPPPPVKQPAKPPTAPPPAPATPAKAPVRLVKLTVPAATEFDIEFRDSLSSDTSKVGDRFRAEIVRDIVIDGKTAVPAGSAVGGSVIEARTSKKVGGRASLGLEFDRMILPSGESAPFVATFADAGKKQTGKDAATIGGATAVGAILGHVLGDDDEATLIGAAVGAAAGTVIAAKNPGDPVKIEAGTLILLSVEEPITVVVEGQQRHFAQVASN